ncbi:MAG: class I mannose-6-phosphate isomerase, partial [Oscillospiraceae bacterium]|nr:class I mannose-6-phosphate isomerase [Oscillospiraceae bacterium]
MTASCPYRRFPAIPVSGRPDAASTGAQAVRSRLAALCHGRDKTVITAECYPGADQAELLALLAPLGLAEAVHSDSLALPPEEIDAAIARGLTEDPVFGILTTRRLEEFFPAENLEAARRKVKAVGRGIVLVYGVGASLVCRGDVLLLADVTRWELQLRFRRGMANWRTAREGLSQREKYKRGYFAEWRWADRVKDRLLPEIDLYLDMTAQGNPAAVTGEAYRAALEQAAARPFRMVPYFDPGVWGGDWMKTRFGLPENGSNYAWSFDGVPEENSLLLDFGGTLVQTPALNLVLSQPRRLLGERVHGRYGKEFPIRFDMLDTIHGQNLSLQVHPLTEYIQQNFNMRYTQDESYYILDTEGDGSCVYLGVKTGTEPGKMREALEEAQAGGRPFPAGEYVNRIPVKKHDHVLIPAGTVHCSGANTMVLEISATPYIFTFKLWDWGRLDLDGKPRPIHLDHGLANIQWDRDTQWVLQNAVNRVSEVYRGEYGVVERTGLHEREPLDTFRVSTAGEMPIRRNGSVHMLNLVEGERALLASGSGAFPPFELRYAETCVVPEAAGD